MPNSGPFWGALDFGRLLRWQVSLMVAGASMFGYLLADPFDIATALPVALGSFLLCAGCSALNQLQEQDIGRLMERTRLRPLPAGNLSQSFVLVLTLSLLLGSLALYGLYGRPMLLVINLGVIVIYNMIYTPLKRVTPMALLIGGIPGALPPLAGWCAAGGEMGHPLILAVTGLFFLWQIPHFWLLVARHKNDFSRAGLPAPPLFTSTGRLNWLLHVWLASMTSLSLSFPALSLISDPLASWGLVAMTLTLVYVSLTRGGKAASVIDMYMLAFMGLLLLDAATTA